MKFRRSLFYFKGIYFPKEHFLQAKKGRHASWGWSSLLEGRDLLMKELCWKIRDGRSVPIWNAPWVQELEGFQLKKEESDAIADRRRVADLILNGAWNLQQISAEFSPEVCRKILKTPIFPNADADQLVWMANKVGCYSVKSGYMVARRCVSIVHSKDPGTSFVIPKSLWKNIWRVAAPPKIQHFLWRLGVGAVATKDALFKRKCSINSVCPVCRSERETVEHLLFLCPWTKLCWFGCPLGLRFSKWSMKRCEEWLCDLLYGKACLDEYRKSVFAMMCWWIWKKRCNWVFREEKPDANEVVKLVTSQVEEFWQSKARRSGLSKRVYMKELAREPYWVRPVDEAIKINFDGSFKASTEEAGIGVVCRNAKAEFVGGLGRPVVASSGFMSECLACREALLCRGKFHGSVVVFETDCEVLYKLVTSKSVAGCDWKCTDLLQDIFRLLESMIDVSWSLVSRQGNQIADRLAADAAKEMHQPSWLNHAPSSLSKLLLHDFRMSRSCRSDMPSGRDREGIG